MFVSKRNLLFKSGKYGYLLFCGNSNSFFRLDDENVPVIKRMFETGDDSELPEDIRKEFIKTGVLLKESDEEFFKRLKFISYQSRFNPYFLSLTIAPTMACNFKCVYCYEGDRVQNVTMTDEVIDGLIKFIKKGEYKTLYLTWYGGEPLCAWEKVKTINDKIKELKIPNVIHNIVTNGSLIDDEKIKFFIDNNFQLIQITVDGDEKIHNERRPMKNGGNSFKSIMTNLDRIYEYCQKENKSLPINVRVNVDKNNLEFYKNFYEQMNKKYNYFFNIYPGFVGKNSEKDCHADSCLNSVEASSFILELAEKYDIPCVDLYPIKNTLTGCGAQSVNTYVVSSNGDLYRCWDDIGLKEYLVGNVVSGIKDEHNLIQSQVMESSGFEEPKCKDCLFLYSCMGGCPKRRMVNKKEGKEINPVCVKIKNLPEQFLESYYTLKQKYEKKESVNN